MSLLKENIFYAVTGRSHDSLEFCVSLRCAQLVISIKLIGITCYFVKHRQTQSNLKNDENSVILRWSFHLHRSDWDSNPYSEEC